MLLLTIMLIPILHVLFSSRSRGGNTFGWFLLVCFMPIFGYIIFLIVTKPIEFIVEPEESIYIEEPDTPGLLESLKRSFKRTNC